MTRFDCSAFFAFFAARFSFRLLPCFLFCPDGGALLAMTRPYASKDGICAARGRPIVDQSSVVSERASLGDWARVWRTTQYRSVAFTTASISSRSALDRSWNDRR